MASSEQAGEMFIRRQAREKSLDNVYLCVVFLLLLFVFKEGFCFCFKGTVMFYKHQECP